MTSDPIELDVHTRGPIELDVPERAKALGPHIGGGGGDFTTVNVELNIAAGLSMYAPIVVEDYITGIDVFAFTATPGTHRVVLYKGTAVAYVYETLTDDYTVTTTGAIRAGAGGSFKITGDGSITIARK